MSKRRHFIYAPPLKGAKLSRRKPVQPPYKGAPAWQCSVYYFWWEYLRRHSGYKLTCQTGGHADYAELYADFGDVHATDFWSWWKDHQDLFAEPHPRIVSVATPHDHATGDLLVVAVPLENKLSLSARQFKRLVEPYVKAVKRRVTTSRAKYPVATKPHLPSLHEHLKVWDIKSANPNLDDADIADAAGIAINHIVDGETLDERRLQQLPTTRIEKALRRRKQLAVQRHLRIAAQYIENVGLGQFPLREHR